MDKHNHWCPSNIVVLLNKQTNDGILRHLKGNTTLLAFRFLIVYLFPPFTAL